MQSASAAALASESSSPSLSLPAAAASAFVSEISASDFVSCGSSSGGSSVFGAITDIDVKVAALSACAPPKYSGRILRFATLFPVVDPLPSNKSFERRIITSFVLTS
jgi:hypothetical protein